MGQKKRSASARPVTPSNGPFACAATGMQEVAPINDAEPCSNGSENACSANVNLSVIGESVPAQEDLESIKVSAGLDTSKYFPEEVSSVRSECEKALVALRRGNSTKALKLIRDACIRHENIALVQRVHGHICMRLASMIEDSTTKQRHLREAIEAAHKAVTLSPRSVECSQFHAQLLFEVATDSKGFEEVVQECKRALEIEDPIDPAKESLHEEDQHKLPTAEARIAQVQQELQNLIQKANIASISNWMKALGNGGSEEKLRFIHMRKLVDDPMEQRVSQPKRPHEVKKSVKTPEEKRKDIEVRVAAARLLQQKRDCSPPHSDDGDVKPMRGATRLERRKSGGSNSKKLNQVQNIEERVERLKPYWNSLGFKEREKMLEVDLDALKEQYSSPKMTSTLELLSEALEFAREKKTWRFWVCCNCEDKFIDGHEHAEHVMHKHVDSLSPKLRRLLPHEIDQDTVDQIMAEDCQPYDGSAAIKLLIESCQGGAEEAAIIGHLCPSVESNGFHCLVEANAPSKETTLDISVGSVNRLTGDASDDSAVRGPLFSPEKEKTYFEASMKACDGKCQRSKKILRIGRNFKRHELPLAEDEERVKLLQKIFNFLGILIRNKCLASDHMEKIVQYALDELQSFIPDSSVQYEFNHSPIYVRFLPAPQLRRIFNYLRELVNACGLDQPSDSVPPLVAPNEEDDVILDRLFLNGGFTLLTLDERLLKGTSTEHHPKRLSSSHEEDPHSVSLYPAKDGEVVSLTDLQLSWVYQKADYEYEPASWGHFREARIQQGRDILRALEKEFLSLQSFCDRKREHLQYEESIIMAETLCIEELKKRELKVDGSFLDHEAVLRKYQQELLGNRTTGLSPQQKLELEVIRSILREAQTINLPQFPYDGAISVTSSRLSDSDDEEEDSWRVPDFVPQLDPCIEVAIQRQKERCTSEVNKLDARILRSMDSVQKLELKLGSVSVLDYRAAVIPLVKAYLKVQLEDAAEKDALQKSDAARDAFLAELSRNEKSASEKFSDSGRHSKEKAKEKKKNKEHKKLKDVKRSSGSAVISTQKGSGNGLYELSMEDNGIQDREAIDGFHLIVVPELRTRIVELQPQQETDWPEFKKTLKEEYFLEDSQRVTKQSFMKWINQKNKGLSARELLREFEKKEQLSSTEQRSIRVVILGGVDEDEEDSIEMVAVEVSQQLLLEAELRRQAEVEDEERKLAETLELQRRVEEEAKERHLAELKKKQREAQVFLQSHRNTCNKLNEAYCEGNGCECCVNLCPTLSTGGDLHAQQLQQTLILDSMVTNDAVHHHSCRSTSPTDNRVHEMLTHDFLVMPAEDSTGQSSVGLSGQVHIDLVGTEIQPTDNLMNPTNNHVTQDSELLGLNSSRPKRGGKSRRRKASRVLQEDNNSRNASDEHNIDGGQEYEQASRPLANNERMLCNSVENGVKSFEAGLAWKKKQISGENGSSSKILGRIPQSSNKTLRELKAEQDAEDRFQADLEQAMQQSLTTVADICPEAFHSETLRNDSLILPGSRGSMPEEVGKGLQNEIGQYNCFLNVVIQSCQDGISINVHIPSRLSLSHPMLISEKYVLHTGFSSLFISDSMVDKGKDKLPVEESSSSTRRHRRETAAADTQFMASARTTARTARAPRPSMKAEEQEENDLFTAQLMSMMGTFEQLAKNPRMQKLLKTKDYGTVSQAETSQQATSRQRQVTEPAERVPTVVTGRPVQHVTQAQDPPRNGYRSNEQSMHPTIPMHTSFLGYFGGGSIFQSMIRPSPGFQGYMPSTGNPMYDNIGVQAGFQIVCGSLGMAGTDLGMAGPSRPYVRPMDLSGGTGVSPNTDIPLLKPHVYDSLTPKGKAKDYKEGGQAVKFEPFFGTTDKMKALIFLQQFDAAFTGGNFTEASKIRKAASFLKADEEVRDIRVAFDKIKESIQYAQQKYKRAADKHRKSLQFKDGDWVLLRFTKARLKMTTGKNWKGEPTDHQKYYMKLAKRYYGPFQILSRINETAYKLRLPANWHIHNAFYVSLLKPFKGDPPTEPVQEEPSLFDDKEEVLQPEEILRHEEKILRSGKSLWHLHKFRQEILGISSMHHVHMGDPCVVCALRDIFVGLNSPVSEMSKDAIAPTTLRLALSNLYSQKDFFQEAQMNDASEVLAVIFECLHKAFTVNSVLSDGDSDSSSGIGLWECQDFSPCIAHSLFALDIAVQMNCTRCGLESRHLKYTSFFHNINANSLRTARILCQESSLDELLRLVDMNQFLGCGVEVGGCGQQNHLHHLLRSAPHVFLIVLGWQNSRESLEDISATMDAIAMDIDIGVIYRGLDKGFKHRLVSVICYYGQHYHCFAFNHDIGRWVMFDDMTVKMVGNYEDVVDTCRRGHLQPQVLFYEALSRYG
ncbi:hypothetical protein L7F22_026969 [Adiantum nelumboides]|nr:hypothetical protein [Adiantum nelumboides]